MDTLAVEWAERSNFLYIKVVKTKHIIEIYEYEKLNVNSTFNPDRADYGHSINAVENYKVRNQMRRDMIRRLAVQNFDKKFDKFVTLTFRDNPDLDITDVKACNAEFKNFVLRLRRVMGKLMPDSFHLAYLAVIEFQDKNDRGAVHYHMLVNLPWIDQKALEAIWGLGFVSINAIDKVDNLGAYVIKYMTPNSDDPRLMGLKAYNCSKGLDRPEVYRSWEFDESSKVGEIVQSLPKEKIVYSDKYTTQHSGKIAYSQVNLKRNSQK